MPAHGWQPLLEQACREVLVEVAHHGCKLEMGGGESIEDLVRKAAERVLAEKGLDAVEGDAVVPEVSASTPTPLLQDLVAMPWTIWSESRKSDSGAAAHIKKQHSAPVSPNWLWASSAEEDLTDDKFTMDSLHSGSEEDLESVPEEERHRVTRRTKVRAQTFQALCPPPEGVRRKCVSFPTFPETTGASGYCSPPTPKPASSTPLVTGLTVVRNGLTMGGFRAQQLLMQWPGRPRVVLLVAKPGDRLISAILQEMAAWLFSQGMVVVLEPQLFKDYARFGGPLQGARTFTKLDQLERSVDLMITIGGDGTLTWAVSLFRGAMPPTLSFAAGSLGFLTPFALDSWAGTLTHLFGLHRGRAPLPLVCRMRLFVTVHRGSDGSPGGASGNGGAAGDGSEEEYAKESAIQVQCLNEVLVHRGQSGALAKLDVGVDGEQVTLVQGDGLILATPTGSTAYSLAAGGSMVHPAVPGILLTPVSPHSLSCRPALLPDSAVITVSIPLTARCGAALSVDGKDICQLAIGDSVEVAMSPHPVPTICLTTETKDWFASVNNALHWNGRAEQKPL